MSGHYPILQGQTQEYNYARRNRRTSYPIAVPWDLVKDHEEQAQKNHSQTLTRLSERGGLSPKELWCIVHDVDFYAAFSRNMTEADAIEWLHTVSGVQWSEVSK